MADDSRRLAEWLRAQAAGARELEARRYRPGMTAQEIDHIAQVLEAETARADAAENDARHHGQNLAIANSELSHATARAVLSERRLAALDTGFNSTGCRVLAATEYGLEVWTEHEDECANNPQVRASCADAADVIIAEQERVQRAAAETVSATTAHDGQAPDHMPYECPGDGICPSCESLAQAMNDMAPEPDN